MDFRGRPGASRARLRPRCRRIVLANPSVCRRPPPPRPPPPMPGTPEARGLETNADLLQFSRGAPSAPPFGSPFPQFTASLRLGYFGRFAKTAANRRSFAGRPLRGCETTFPLQRIGVCLQNNVCAVAGRRSCCSKSPFFCPLVYRRAPHIRNGRSKRPVSSEERGARVRGKRPNHAI